MFESSALILNRRTCRYRWKVLKMADPIILMRFVRQMRKKRHSLATSNIHDIMTIPLLWILMQDSARAFRLWMHRHQRKIFMMNFIASLYGSVLKEKSLWTKDRTDHWWQYIVNRTFSANDWLENFRMSQQSFKKLCEMLRPYIQRSDTHMRRCIPVEQRVGVALWTLATNVEYHTVGHLFGISRSALCLIVKEVCQAIHNHLLHKYIYLPCGQELLHILLQFETTWGFPNCAGAIDGCHIPIIAPQESHTDYYNRKGFYSMLLQATVGKVHDARVLANSEIFHRGQAGELFPNEVRTMCGTDVPVVILGDPAYPLLTWLMKPYAETARTTPSQHRFNYMLSRNRMVVENAFGRLKGRWRHLLKRMDFKIELVPIVISACCVLHNFFEIEGDKFPDEWHLDPLTPEVQANHEPSGDETEHPEMTTADNIREAFCRYFSTN